MQINALAFCDSCWAVYLYFFSKQMGNMLCKCDFKNFCVKKKIDFQYSNHSHWILIPLEISNQLCNWLLKYVGCHICSCRIVCAMVAGHMSCAQRSCHCSCCYQSFRMQDLCSELMTCLSMPSSNTCVWHCPKMVSAQCRRFLSFL